MRLLFVDTAGWMAMADESDPLHRAALRVRDKHLEKAGLLVTTDYVMDESLTLIRVRIGLDAAGAFWEQTSESPRLRWERIDTRRFQAAKEWFFRWKDKSFSFTDCTSFVVMRELHLKKALTCDRHFRDAGFAIVP
jgi:uncharacterized protein